MASPINIVTIEGWLLSKHGYRVRLDHLRKSNPGYQVFIERYARTDLGRRGTFPRAGFRVNARGPKSLPPFQFSIADTYGDSHLLPLSNSNALFQARFFPQLIDDSPLDLVEYSQGYIDSILQSSLGIDNDSGTWLSMLAHLYPAEMLELAESRFGQFLAPIIADLLTVSPSHARWADRFALAAHGDKGIFISDLTVVAVEAAHRAGPTSVAHPLLLPILRRSGNVLHAVPGVQIVPVPDPTWLHLRDASVQNGGTVFIGNTLIVYEESADPRRDFVAGQWDTVFGSRSHPNTALVKLMQPAPTVVPEGILLAGRNDFNWFHWLIEYLPRVLQIGSSISPDVPLLISARTPPSGIAALLSITARPVLTIDPETSQSVTMLHVVAPPVQVLDTTRVPWADGLSINPAPLRAMRKLWRLDDRPLANPGRMLFLSRTSANRGLVNEVRLAVIASEYGLEILDPGAMSFEDQLSAFSSASLLVGASGAVMANYLMMMPGSRILALTSDALTDFILPAAIAAVSGASFTYLSGPTTKSLAKSGTRNEWMHSDFLISEKQFRAALINALADQRRYLRHRDIIARPETAAAIREKGLDDVRV